jgi:hypothetical protein
MMKKVLYSSPFMTNVLIPEAALSTYKRRDQALLALKELGGIQAPLTKEVNKLRKIMLNARRKIEREGWGWISQ